jgi:signal peptidase I
MARPYVAPSGAPRTPVALRPALGMWLLSSAAVVFASWWILAPPALGGSATFVTVDGTSMLPKLHRDELVLLRPSSSYHVGQVVGYRSRLLHRIVLHRIVAFDGGRYTFKGDNNSFLDPERPVSTQLVGRMEFRIPGIGRLIPLLHVPWLLGALAGVLVLALGLEEGRDDRAEQPASS